MNTPTAPAAWPRAVLFDLLSALLDSWTVWNTVAGSEQRGRAWRAEYLRLTYGCGAYVAYEDLVRQAAHNTGLPETVCEALAAEWPHLPVWSGVSETLAEVQRHCKLAVVTNCSQRLGRIAADRIGIAWDVVVTSEEAGFYKPDPHPYQMALEKLGVQPAQAAFVAGSGYDMFGTSRVGLRTYWHNRIGLSLPSGAPAPEVESPTLDGLPDWLAHFHPV
ncbi:HAD family hydrolase [Propionivibrio dicarboxylicus]|uniref:2-haloalkanoic acid dehalogenase, type II n=1 Tax=Propionivibrio dicarboxylicus TaxID=83767 RepID=A0A1G8AJW3_9RHOO|nr:HAD-IA family hydrolase [Propionivibrio dicarboxylicus]SDH21264.1 2-haloalkanoic acid dehalogenase, type II [Propionivibrio dicarboxylicus]